MVEPPDALASFLHRYAPMTRAHRDRGVSHRAATYDTGETALHTTADRLAELAEGLAVRGDPFFARPELQTLAARLAVLPDERRQVVEVASDWQRSVLAALAANQSEHGTELRWKRELRVVQRSLERLVEIAGTWPLGVPLDPGEVTLQFARHDVAALVRDICAAFAPLAHDRRLDFRVDLPDTLPGEIDGAKIEAAVVNLIFNAFKMTPEDGVMRVEIEINALTNEALMSVSDSGPGLPHAHVHTLFNRHRSWERSANPDRLGFSLGRSRDFLELHGGELRAAHRSQRRGAEFLVRIPLQAPRGLTISSDVAQASTDLPRRAAHTARLELEVEASLGEKAPPRDERPLVLIVDDSRAIHRVLAEELGATCRTASAFDGVAGLRKAAELQPDMIIADLELPRMDGKAMIRAFRSDQSLCEIPILGITGQDSSEIVQLLEEGVQDVLRKPFVLPEVRARVRTIIAAKRARDVLRALVGERETDLVRLADDVYRHQRKLEAALDEVRVARELAETAGRVKTNFLRMVSHELRTPVTALSLQLQLLMREPAMTSRQRGADGLARMSRSISRLLHLVDTVIEWARVESGRFHVSAEQIDLLQIATDAVREVEPQTRVKALQLVLEDPPNHLPPLDNDPRLVRLVVINLLEHAVRVTEAGEIRVRLAHGEGGHRLQVIDGAPPISRAERFDLFEPLRSTEDLALMKGAGSGLGLYVVRDIARAIGGDVTLREDTFPGNAFELSLTDRAPASAQNISRRDDQCHG